MPTNTHGEWDDQSGIPKWLRKTIKKHITADAAEAKKQGKLGKPQKDNGGRR